MTTPPTATGADLLVAERVRSLSQMYFITLATPEREESQVELSNTSMELSYTRGHQRSKKIQGNSDFARRGIVKYSASTLPELCSSEPHMNVCHLTSIKPVVKPRRCA